MFNLLKQLFNLFQPQKEFGGTGALKNIPDVRDISLASVQPRLQIPDKFITDLSAIPVLNQGYLGTCVAHAMVEMKMYQEYIETKTIILFSRRIFYVLSRALSGLLSTDGQGLYPRDSAKILTQVGVTPDYKYNVDDYRNLLSHENYCALQVTDAMKDDAKIYKVGGYAFPDTTSAYDLMQAIYQNGVFTATLEYDSSSWYSALLNKVKKVLGFHHILIYGYETFGADDVMFFFRNSWGTIWGNGGNGKFIFSDYKGHISDAITFVDLPNKIIEDAKSTQYIFLRDLKRGMTGSDVLKLQNRLFLEKVFDGKQDGSFGPYTESCVRNYQSKHGISPTGFVGPITRQQLNKSMQTKIKSKIDMWCEAIEKMEGSKPELHNPGNLRYIGQASAIGKDSRGFCIFPDYATGYMTLRKMLVNACSGVSKIYHPTDTLYTFYSKYAPDSDGNNSKHYAEFVAKYVGVLPTIIIKELL